jgi:hypothetical protein
LKERVESLGCRRSEDRVLSAQKVLVSPSRESAWGKQRAQHRYENRRKRSWTGDKEILALS